MKKHLLALNLFNLILIPSVGSLILTSCSTNGIVFANYEGYMSPDLMQRLHNDGNVKFIPYATNEDILAKFKKSYDIAVPSTYMVLELIKKGYLSEISWNNLDVNSPINIERYSTPNVIDCAKPSNEYIQLTEKARNDPKNAQSLFSDTIDDIIDSIDEWSHKPENDYYPSNKSLLDYGLPYFLQDLMFAYHGSQINELPFSDEHNGQWYSEKIDGNPINWSDIRDAISTKSSNTDERFKHSNHGPQMAVVDDSRSIFDMCHLIGGNPPNKDVNPFEDESTDINDLKNIYESFTNKFNKKSYLLNSDSQQVLYTFAKPMKNDSQHAYSNGIVSWNGDVLYSVIGAGIDKWKDIWTNTNTHAVKPLKTLVALDMCVINKNIENDLNKKNQAYEMLRKVCLEGCNLNATSDNDGIGKRNENDEFVNGPTLNFNYQGYTPTLWNLNKFVAKGLDNENDSYFQLLYPNDENKAKLCASIANINFEEGLLELPLSDLTKSNMSIAWTKVKEGL